MHELWRRYIVETMRDDGAWVAELCITGADGEVFARGKCLEMGGREPIRPTRVRLEVLSEKVLT